MIMLSGKLRKGGGLMRKTMVIFIALVLTSTSAWAEMTVKELLRQYDSGNAKDRAFIEGMINQTNNGLGWANSHLIVSRHEQPIYCEPNKYASTGSQIIEMLRREMGETPELGGYPFGLGIMTVNIRVFPCAPSKNSN